MTVFSTRTSQHPSLLLFLLLISLGRLAFAQELITNGSLTGTPANDAVPSGWSVVTPTTDLNNISASNAIPGTTYPWLGIPVVSPDGGTFESVIHSEEFGIEEFGTTVSGLTIGRTYKFSYYWALTPFLIGGINAFPDPARPVVTLTGLEGYTQVASFTSTAWNWVQVSQTVTATAATATLNFKALSFEGTFSSAYLSFDGISLIADCSSGTVAPVPSANTLAVCGVTADLTTLQSGTAPSGSAFRWHTGTPGTTANAVTTPTAAAAPGTYYLAYFDDEAKCYSPTSTAVTVTSTTPATPAITAVDPTCTVLTGGISVSSPVSGATYTLSPGGATSTTGEFTGLAPSSGPYTVTSTVSGCTSPASNQASVGAPATGCVQPCAANAGTITMNP